MMKALLFFIHQIKSSSLATCSESKGKRNLIGQTGTHTEFQLWAGVSNRDKTCAAFNYDSQRISSILGTQGTEDVEKVSHL